ncbi:MAG: hypothetical protein ACYSVY_00225 [Planctomycetota bacterium]|jgi:NADH:ubiquinone oxidoreductase subunit F (NADH-binding)
MTAVDAVLLFTALLIAAAALAALTAWWYRRPEVTQAFIELEEAMNRCKYEVGVMLLPHLERMLDECARMLDGMGE